MSMFKWQCSNVLKVILMALTHPLLSICFHLILYSSHKPEQSLVFPNLIAFVTIVDPRLTRCALCLNCCVCGYGSVYNLREYSMRHDHRFVSCYLNKNSMPYHQKYQKSRIVRLVSSLEGLTHLCEKHILPIPAWVLQAKMAGSFALVLFLVWMLTRNQNHLNHGHFELCENKCENIIFFWTVLSLV